MFDRVASSGKPIRPPSGYASFWSSPEWSRMVKLHSLKEISFDQGPLGHCRRKPTSIGSNMEPHQGLQSCRGPGVQAGRARTEMINASKGWSVWAPGHVQALRDMLRAFFVKAERWRDQALMKMDASFMEHVRQQHMPYRRDCKHCIQGGARHKPHRRVLTPQAWTLSVDTTGPFKHGLDEGTNKAKYLVVGVLTIPRVGLESPKAEPVRKTLLLKRPETSRKKTKPKWLR